MLVRFPCDRCGAELAAHPQFAGESVRCDVCRNSVTVPAVATPPPVQTRLKRMDLDEEVAAEIAELSYEEARLAAMLEAKRVTARGRWQGVGLAVLGGLAVLFGAAALAMPTLLWVPSSSAVVTIAFGALALLIGLAVWRLAVQTMHEEYRRRVPGLADRFRRRRWDARRSTPPSPRIATG
jgi:hypothetical protein